MRTTVLAGFAEALSGPEVVWSLVDGGYSVAVFGRKGRRSALRHSRHVTCYDITAPESDLQGSIAELHSLLKTLGGKGPDSRSVLLPMDDTALWLCNQVVKGSGWVLAGPSGDLLELALDKKRQCDAARAAGLNVVETFHAASPEDFAKLDMGFPIILKPSKVVLPRGGRLASCRKWICENRSELDAAVRSWAGQAPLLVQPFISGTGEGVFGLACAGEVRALSAHRRVRMMDPHGSGSSACESRPVSEEIRGPLERFVLGAGWRGLFMVELLRDESGKAWFVEFNGRAWGSMALARRLGLEYPAWSVALALDPQSRPGRETGRFEPRICRHLGREFLHLLFVLRGPKSRALKRWPSFWRTLGQVARIRRRDGVYNWRRDDKKVFFADFYHTVASQVFKPRKRGGER